MTEVARHPGVEETCAALSQVPTGAARIVYHLLSCPACLERTLTLSIEDQAQFALWGIKTVMMWMTVPPGAYLIPLEHYLWLRTHKLPAPDYRARLGRYDAIGKRLAWSFFVPAALRDINDPEPARTDTHRSVVGFGHLVFEIQGPMSHEGFRHPSPPLNSGTFLLDIWPGDNPKPLSWPPTHTFDEGEMLQFLEIPPDTELPNPGAE